MRLTTTFLQSPSQVFTLLIILSPEVLFSDPFPNYLKKPLPIPSYSLTNFVNTFSFSFQVLTLLSLLDPQKYSFSDPFANYLKHPANPEPLSTPSYFLNLVTRVAHVLPSMGETLFSRQTLHIARAGTPARWGGNPPASPTPWELTSVFARHQDCATQGQLLMTTAEVELLALPFPIEKTVKGLVGAALYPENVAQTERGTRPTMG